VKLRHRRNFTKTDLRGSAAGAASQIGITVKSR
jgi:hypothetical protein